jgi:hypothetical protein
MGAYGRVAGCQYFGRPFATVSLWNQKTHTSGGEMRPKESLLSIFAVLCMSFLLFTLAGTSPAVSVAYADNSGSLELPADTSADTMCTAIGDNDTGEDSIIDIMVDIINAVL